MNLCIHMIGRRFNQKQKYRLLKQNQENICKSTSKNMLQKQQRKATKEQASQYNQKNQKLNKPVFHCSPAKSLLVSRIKPCWSKRWQWFHYGFIIYKYVSISVSRIIIPISTVEEKSELPCTRQLPQQPIFESTTLSGPFMTTTVCPRQKI